MTSLSKLPVVPVRKVGQLAVKKDFRLFTAVRAMGLAWEQFYDHYRKVGHLKATDAPNVALRGGDLALKTYGRWRGVRQRPAMLGSGGPQGAHAAKYNLHTM